MIWIDCRAGSALARVLAKAVHTENWSQELRLSQIVVLISVHVPSQSVVQRQPFMHSPSVLKVQACSVPSTDQASIRLRYTRIADAHGDALQGKLKNIVQSIECRR